MREVSLHTINFLLQQMEEGKEETDESLERSRHLQAGGPTLVSPVSDVEEDLTNTSERIENEDKDCDSSRSSSPGWSIVSLIQHSW